jgi:predicted RNA binding protein YcfA (HicA-like mRNA interferase family)
VSVKRREVIRYLEASGFHLLREGARVVPVKRHRQLDRITANAICKEAGVPPKF